MATNPVLNELQTLSPAAQQALVQAHQIAAPVTAGQSGGPAIQAHTPVAQDAGPAPAAASITHPMMTSEVPSIGGGQAPQVAHSSLIDHQNELNRVVGSGSGISQIAGKVENSGLGQAHPLLGKILGIGAQGLATLGNVGLDAVAPAVSAALPGTDYAHDRLVKQDQRQVAGDVKNAQDQAQTAQSQVMTQEAPQKATDAHDMSQVQQGNIQSEEDARDNPSTNWQHIETDQGVFAHNPKTNELIPLTYQGKPLQPFQKDPAAKGMDHVNIIGPNGKPMIGNYNPTTGVTTDSAGKPINNPQPYEKPNVTNNNVASGREFQEEERGRGLLDKAESSYRTAQQGANTIRAMIDNANSGDKMTARMLPLEGALEITTAQGVHRINRTEVDQYAGGGSAYDRLAGQLKGAATGIPFTAEIMKSMKNLSDIQEKGAYDTYKGAYDSATRRYGLKDEQALPGPGGATGGGPQPGAAPQGADNEVYVGGKLVGHTVGGKYVALAK